MTSAWVSLSLYRKGWWDFTSWSILYRQGIEKSVIWLYLFAEVRGRDRGQQYEPPYCFDRIPHKIKIFTKSSHPKLPVKFPTQTNPTIRKISTPQKILRSYPSLEIRSTPLGSLPVYLLPLCGYPGQVRVTLFQAPRLRARGRGIRFSRRNPLS